ncbi:MAG: hypothetical protein PVH77_03140 [Phycisphaerales bacterium]|jgi:hypothetical protein
MNPENNNPLSRDSLNQQEKNISRLMKLTGDSDKPNRAFTESLIGNALGKLEQFKSATKQDEKNITIKISWWEKVLGCAAMFAVICLAGLGFLVSQIHSAFAVIVLVVMFVSRIVHLGGLIL